MHRTYFSQYLRLVCFATGCPRVAGDEEDSFDHDDFEDEFQLKKHAVDASDQNKYASNHSVN